MRFSLPSIKCSAAPPSFRLCCLNCTRRFDLITARSAVVGSLEEPPNIWLTVAKNAFVGWDLNFRVRMLLKSAVNDSFCGKQMHVHIWMIITMMTSFCKTECKDAFKYPKTMRTWWSEVPILLFSWIYHDPFSLRKFKSSFSLVIWNCFRLCESHSSGVFLWRSSKTLTNLVQYFI